MKYDPNKWATRREFYQEVYRIRREKMDKVQSIPLIGYVMAGINYSGQSKFHFWHDVVSGDVLKIQLIISPGSTLVPRVRITNQRTGDVFNTKPGAMKTYLESCNYDVLEHVDAYSD